MDLEKLATETINPRTIDIDKLSSNEIVRLINSEDKVVHLAVELEIESIARAIDEISNRFVSGGRMIYIGAGTSGRLGALDAAELMPTFGVPSDRAFGIIAGGQEAMFKAIEGAEDSVDLAIEDLKNINLTSKDSVICIAASGRTPYTLAALEFASNVGSLTVSITCNPGSPIAKLANVAISPVVGAEVIAGSTRMKAGTAQKMVLNMISTGVMIKTGKVYKNLMVNLEVTNDKLSQRAINIVKDALNIPKEDAEVLMESVGNRIPVAIVAYYTGIKPEKILETLMHTDNNISKTIDMLGSKEEV